MYPNKQHSYVLYLALTFITISKFGACLSS